MRVSANQVTTLRLLAMPLVGYTIYGNTHLRIVGVVIGTLIGLTDLVDGYLARRQGPTVLGSLLDPVADKIFIVVCYGCYVDRGGIPWWVAAIIFSRELLVTVLRSSLELGGRRLPSSGLAKAKTWVQMLGFAFLILIPIVGSGPPLRMLFAVPLVVLLAILSVARLVAGRRLRALELAAPGFVALLVGSLAGPAASQTILLTGVVLITWVSAVDYLKLGFQQLGGQLPQKGLHWVRLLAGATLPVVTMAALATDRCPTIPLIVLLSSDMARGALDNFVAHRGVADFFWGASLWVEIALLAGALAFPPVSVAFTILAALVAVVETSRGLVKHLRAPAPVVRVTAAS